MSEKFKPFPNLRRTYGVPSVRAHKDFTTLIKDVNKILEWRKIIVKTLEKKIVEAKKQERNRSNSPYFRQWLRGYIKAHEEFLEALK